MNEMLKNKVWAVVGVNDNPNKFGYMIYNELKIRSSLLYKAAF